MQNKIDFQKGFVNKGNQIRLKKLFDRAASKEKLTIACFGGSITQGSLATSNEKCYASRIFKWWETTFSETEFSFVNDGIGGTTSLFGVARVEDDLLRYKPDFVIIDFSVNDECDNHFMETYEGLIRKIYYFETKPAVLLLHNVFYDTGRSAERVHRKIGRHYDIPSVSVRPTIYEAVLDGVIENREITPDDLHPNDEGHQLLAEQIIAFLEMARVNASCEEEKTVEAISKNRYENTKRFDNRNITPAYVDFEIDKSLQAGITDCFKNGWIGHKNGQKIVFEFEGTGLSVQYRRSIKKPAAIAKVTIDGNAAMSFILDGNFDETWGDKLELETLTENLQKGQKHSVEIEVIDAGEDKTPFYLNAIMVNTEV